MISDDGLHRGRVPEGTGGGHQGPLGQDNQPETCWPRHGRMALRQRAPVLS